MQLLPRPNCENWQPCGGDGTLGLFGLFSFFAMAPAQSAAPWASVSFAALYCCGGCMGSGLGLILARSGVIQIGESGECGFFCAWVFAVAIGAKFCAVPNPILYDPLD